MDNTLTNKQEQILDYIKQVLREKSYPPSVREICAAVALSSTSTVHSHLNTLEKKGYIRRDPTKPRTIEVLDAEHDWLMDHVSAVPVIGKVTAGEPILAIENIEEYFPLPNHMARNEEIYMLKVVGVSMINAGILDGDQIIVRKQTSAQNGDIVVALLGDDVTVKRFFKDKDIIRLQPENDTMAPIYSKEVTILGKVIGLFREF
ncbi:MAG: SOS-response transcriptional repressor, LexA [Clostridia bacterium]|jgi:repressor LexA|nr:SOS-response transcriptional repressor, LexA [Clostridia bacterium]